MQLDTSLKMPFGASCMAYDKRPTWKPWRVTETALEVWKKAKSPKGSMSALNPSRNGKWNIDVTLEPPFVLLLVMTDVHLNYGMLMASKYMWHNFLAKVRHPPV